MEVNDVLALLVALAIANEIQPEELAKIFMEKDKVQEYYEAVLLEFEMAQ